MFERIDYRVIRIDGEYAYLQNWKMKMQKKSVWQWHCSLRRFRRAVILHMR